jgi:hypothetical protein
VSCGVPGEGGERRGEQVRLMTNSRKAQSEKLATGGGRETTAVKPDNKLGPKMGSAGSKKPAPSGFTLIRLL